MAAEEEEEAREEEEEEEEEAEEEEAPAKNREMLWKHNANDCEGKWGVQNVSSIFRESCEGSLNAKQLKSRLLALIVT